MALAQFTISTSQYILRIPHFVFAALPKVVSAGESRPTNIMSPPPTTAQALKASTEMVSLFTLSRNLGTREW
jgi:hypothetical protein